MDPLRLVEIFCEAAQYVAIDVQRDTVEGGDRTQQGRVVRVWGNANTYGKLTGNLAVDSTHTAGQRLEWRPRSKK